MVNIGRAISVATRTGVCALVLLTGCGEDGVAVGDTDGDTDGVTDTGGDTEGATPCSEDCSSIQTTDCTKGVCDEESGYCITVAIADGAPCDDG